MLKSCLSYFIVSFVWTQKVLYSYLIYQICTSKDVNTISSLSCFLETILYSSRLQKSFYSNLYSNSSVIVDFLSMVVEMLIVDL